MSRLLPFLLILCGLITLAPGLRAQVQPGFQNTIITAPVTYYVCAKASGGTCVYNGDGGTVAPTISDNNGCLTKATPCATINGVASKVNGSILAAAIVTVQLADTAGTGTDCYRPNGTRFEFPARGSARDQLEDSMYLNSSGSYGSYPPNYLFIQGNTTTPGNVIITGATTCAGTTATDNHGILFTNMVARVRGMLVQYFAQPTSGDGVAFAAYASHLYVEDINCTGDQTTETMIAAGFINSYVRLGGSLTWAVSNCAVLDLWFSVGQASTPLGRPAITETVGSTWNPVTNGGRAIITANEGSVYEGMGMTLTVSQATGSNRVFVWSAQHGAVYADGGEAVFTLPAISETFNGAGLVLYQAVEHGYISADCRTVSNMTCSIGGTTAIDHMAEATQGSRIDYSTSNSFSSTNGDTIDTGAQIKLLNASNSANTNRVSIGQTTFANIGNPTSNGVMTYCSDCLKGSNPCSGSSTGTMAFRVNGAWICF